MREKYQGIVPPVPRSEADFDPGAKYHVAANVPYTRYFLARILQFQFYPRHVPRSRIHRPAASLLVLWQQGGWSEAARHARNGTKQALARRALRPHRRAPDGRNSAMLEYFAPLKQWLDEQNKGQKVGWTLPK